jgi:hypothetical protein
MLLSTHNNILGFIRIYRYNHETHYERNEQMKIGGGIFLMALGAILAFAVQDNWDVIDLTLIGYILLGAGVLVTLLGIIFATRKRTSVATTSSSVDPITGQGVTRSERAVD